MTDAARKPQPESRLNLRDVVAFAGLVLIAVGVCAFDWRIGCIALGVLLLATGIVCELRATPPRRPPERGE